MPLKLPQAEVIKTVTDSGLRGRGGAAFLRAFNGIQFLIHHQNKNTLSVMPDEGDSAHFPIAWSWKATLLF